MRSLSGSLLNTVRIGQWEFHRIGPWIFLYWVYQSHGVSGESLVGQLYLWAASRSRLRQILWRIVDGLLVTFGYLQKPCTFSAPSGPAGPRELAEVV